MIVRIAQFFRPFKEFIRTKVTGGVILLFCVALALIIVNSDLKESYHHFFETNLGVQFSNFAFERTLHFWINDGLMAVFFLLVGLEIKRELLEGELADFKKSSLPIIAAIGGMIVPAIFYGLANIGNASISGWGIPMATDIAFAVAIMSILGNRVPLALKIFLTALAIVDDLGAIIVIAIFYTNELNLTYLFYAAIVMVVLYGLNISRVKSLIIYLPIGLVLWYFVYMSGIHATISGVLLALMIPTNKGNKISPLEYLEHLLNKPVSYIIMPLFALSNTDIVFQSDSIASLGSSIGIGIIAGLFLGKVVGISLFSWLSIRVLKLSQLPNNTNWMQIIGAGFLGGIGFTMSIFISLLSFDNLEWQNTAKISILLASVLSGLTGYLLLSLSKAKDETDELIEVQAE